MSRKYTIMIRKIISVLFDIFVKNIEDKKMLLLLHTLLS